jgi:hypothetical protein
MSEEQATEYVRVHKSGEEEPRFSASRSDDSEETSGDFPDDLFEWNREHPKRRDPASLDVELENPLDDLSPFNP